MKRLLPLLFLLLLAVTASGQVPSSFTLGVRTRGATLPASCSDNRRLYVLTAIHGANPVGLYKCDGSNYVLVSGNVAGAASSTDNAVARFDGTGGKTLQNSLVTIDDSGSVNIPTGQTYKINNVALAKGDVGLGNVDNTSDANKPVSSAAQTALDAKEAVANKSIDVTADGASDTKYPSVKAVKTYVDASGGGTPGGSDTQIQFNDGGAFGGDSKLTFNKTALSTTKPTLLALTTSSNVGTLNQVQDGAAFRNFFNTHTPTASMINGGTFSFIGEEHALNVNGLSIGDSAISSITVPVFPINGVITGTIAINDTDGSGGVAPRLAAVNGSAIVTTSVASALDGVDGDVVGGRFHAELAHPSNAGGIISAFGVQATARGALSTTGGHNHYGVGVEVSGAGGSNYGYHAAVSPDATNNYGLFIESTLTSGANNYAIRSLSEAQSTFGGSIEAPQYRTTTNCADSAGAAACGSAAAGAVVIDASATSVVVSTTAVTADSQIFIQEDSSLSTRLGVTCNTTIARSYVVTARTAGTSFTITASAAPSTDPACLSYKVVN